MNSLVSNMVVQQRQVELYTLASNDAGQFSCEFFPKVASPAESEPKMNPNDYVFLFVFLNLLLRTA